MHNYFYGWYFKFQSRTQTLAVIPAIHRSGQNGACSIQVVTEDQAWNVEYPASAFHRRGDDIWIGENRFGERGVSLAVHTPKLDMSGELRFGTLLPLKYDIMGPFSMLPFLECRHSVYSMRHVIDGNMLVDGRKFLFQNASGYWEGDQGRSFPREYAWTQCCFPGGSLMLAVADVPVAGIHFRGIIGVVIWKGREYRLATYLGARVVQARHGRIRVVQGNLELEARLLEEVRSPLKAPSDGNMTRTIRENAACWAFYRFRKGKYTFFSFKTDRASFEYEY